MTDNQLFILGLLAAIPPTLAAVVALIASLRNGKAIKDLHIEINSRMSQLLSITGASQRAEGVIEGQSQAATAGIAAALAAAQAAKEQQQPGGAP